MKVIGLTGRERVGKGTVAGMIEEILGDQYHVKVEGFADRLKISAARALGLGESGASDDELIAAMDRLKVEGGVGWTFTTPCDKVIGGEIDGRRFLQLYGTEAHREVFGDDFWVDAVLPTTFPHGEPTRGRTPTRNDCDVLVVHDVRFPNEAERVRAYGGQVWRIIRPGYSDGPTTHASQQTIEGDLCLNNRHGLEYLRGSVDLALGPIIAELDERQQPLVEVPR